MDTSETVRTLATELEAERDGESWRSDQQSAAESAGGEEYTKETVLEHTSEVFQTLQDKVKELSAQLNISPDRLYDDQLGPRTPEPEGSQHLPATPSNLFSPDVEQCVRNSVAELEMKLESVLENVTEDLAAEVGREQQHLMLMQQQVDKQGQMLLREIASLQSRLDQERTQRSFVQSQLRDSKDLVGTQLAEQASELAALRTRLAQLETPWVVRALGSLSGMIWGSCAAGRGPAQSGSPSRGTYEMMPEPRGSNQSEDPHSYPVSAPMMS